MGNSPPADSAIVYILCHNEERLKRAREIYAAYPWAKPIQMKYQNATFENAFWPQMWHMRGQWRRASVVGAFSFRAFQKVNMRVVDRVIREKRYEPSGYYHFLNTPVPVLNHESLAGQRNLFALYWNDMLDALGLNDTTSAHCNYFIARPNHMLGFIKWHYWRARIVALQHPLALARYEYNGRMTSAELMRVCNRPYYPFVPFILERLNKCWFDKHVLRINPVPHRTRLPKPAIMPPPAPAIPTPQDTTTKTATLIADCDPSEIDDMIAQTVAC